MSKLNISTSRVKERNSFHVPSTNITTLDVGRIIPSNILPLEAGDRVSVNYNQFSRLSPLLVPTFGSFRLKTYAFYVPYRTIWRGYQDFRSESVDNSTNYNRSPLTWSLIDLFQELFGTLTLQISSESTAKSFLANYGKKYFSNVAWFPNVYQAIHGTTDNRLGFASDLSIYRATDEEMFDVYLNGYNFNFASENNTVPVILFKFNESGRQLINTLYSLGYSFPTEFMMNMNYELNQPYGETDPTPAYEKQFKFSFYPLLAYCRALYDYVYPSRYVQQQGFGFLFDYPYEQTVDALFSKCMKLLFTQYEDSFYTQLWTGRNRAAVGMFTDTNMSPDDNSALKVNGDGSGTYVRMNSASNVTTLSTQSLRLMQSINDFVVRNNIGGTRFSEWFKAHFGFATQEMNSDRSIFLKSWFDDIQIGDVTNGSFSQDGNMGVLGEQAGKGTISSKGSLKFEAKEAGFLIFVSLVQPQVGYYQGVKPWCTPITSPKQFYTPEFETFGLEAIPRKAVYNSYDGDDADAPYNVAPIIRNNEVFGYAPRYAWQYKIGHDFLTGDFRFGSRNWNLGSYHTFRNVLYGRSNLALDAQFMQVDNQYDRIFSDINGDESRGLSNTDKIFTIFYFDITKYSYMRPISDSLPIFDKSGENTSLDNGGFDLQ